MTAPSDTKRHFKRVFPQSISRIFIWAQGDFPSRKRLYFTIPFKQLAGILLEISGDPNGECQVVIGIGINVRLHEAQLDTITQPATDLCNVMGRSVDKNQVVGELIKYLVSYLDQFQMLEHLSLHRHRMFANAL
jgi:hypothetical protein